MIYANPQRGSWLVALGAVLALLVATIGVGLWQMSSAPATVPPPVSMPAAADTTARPGLIIDRFYNLYMPNVVSPSLKQMARLRVEIEFNDLTGRYADASTGQRNDLQSAFLYDHMSTYANFNDILTLTMANKTPAELATPAGKEALREELMAKFNQALAGTPDTVLYVNFLEFQIQ